MNAIPNFIDYAFENKMSQQENIRKILTGKGDDYAFSCLLDYSYFKGYYRFKRTMSISKINTTDRFHWKYKT